MREVCLLNKGTSLNKIKQEYQIIEELHMATDKIMDSEYVEIKKGCDDITLIKNYYPYYEYVVKENESMMDIMARGFEVVDTINISTNDTILINKPRSIRYSVKPLEKIEEIAVKFGVNVDYIMEANKLYSDKLFVGQILWI